MTGGQSARQGCMDDFRGKQRQSQRPRHISVTFSDGISRFADIGKLPETALRLKQPLSL